MSTFTAKCAWCLSTSSLDLGRSDILGTPFAGARGFLLLGSWMRHDMGDEMWWTCSAACWEKLSPALDKAYDAAHVAFNKTLDFERLEAKP